MNVQVDYLVPGNFVMHEHEVVDLKGIDTLYLRLDGSNANTTINIQGQSLVNVGNLGVGITSGLGAKVHIKGTANEKQLIVQANSTQTANLQEWQNSSGTSIGAITASGGLALAPAAQQDAGLYNIRTRGYLSIGNVSTTAGSNSIFDVVDLQGSIAGGSTWRGMRFLINANGAGTGLYNITAIEANARDISNNTQNIGSLVGINSSAGIQSNVTATNAYAIVVNPNITNASGTITNVVGIRLNPRNDGTFTNYYGIDIIKPTGIGTVSNDYYGIRVANISGATNNFAIYTNAGLVRFGDKVIFTQTDGNEYIDSLADGYMDYGATTAHRFNNDIDITGNCEADTYSVGEVAGASGTFTTADSKTITVTNGIITSIV